MSSSSLVHSGPDRGSPHSGTELFFATRTGTRLGIEAHLFRVETTKDLSLWTRHIVNGCHASAEMIKEVTTSKRSWKITNTQTWCCIKCGNWTCSWHNQRLEKTRAVQVTELGALMLPLTGSGMLQQHNSTEV